MKKEFPRTNLRTRSSTIANAMAHSIVFIDDIAQGYSDWLSRFNQIVDSETCVYCGKSAGTYDHIYNLVENKLPTGYNTEKNNLAPCCSQCNSKKGKKNWEVFMNSEYCKNFGGWVERKKIMSEVLDKYPPLFINFEKVLGSQYNDYLEIKNKINQLLLESDDELIKMRLKIDEVVKKKILTSKSN